MRTALIHLVGVTPILFDRMSDSTINQLIGIEGKQTKQKDRPLVDVAREKIYREFGEEGKIGIPQEMLFACLVAAGRNVKIGKKQISTATSTMIPGLLTIADFFMPFTNVIEGKEDEAWRVDKRRGQLDSGGKKGAVGLVRPRFEKWELTVKVEFDDKVANESVIQALFTDAGKSQGLGSFRPNKKGPFGRFAIAKWELLEKPVELSQAA